MRPGARVQAAIKVLEDIATSRRPAQEALRDWGRTHRFAGSGDRAAIGNLVFDVLRKRESLAWQMGSDAPRALVMAALCDTWTLEPANLAHLFSNDPYAPEPPTPAEVETLGRDLADDVPPAVAANVPAWTLPLLERVFGEEGAVAAGRALATRAPVDVRTNTLKATRDKVFSALKRFAPAATLMSPIGLRIAHPAKDGRAPAIESDAAHGKGWIEVQDEGSQIAALLCDARPGQQVLDLCAGAGGKTLALAASMENTGQIHAYDADPHRLRPIWERLKRAGVRNVQVLQAREKGALTQLAGRMDRVLVDAPCTGSGTWRRRPDAKWRVTPKALEARIAEQDRVLATAAPLVKPGGRLIFVTCSLFAEESEDRIARFGEANPDFALVPAAGVWRERLAAEPPEGVGDAARLTPHLHGTDGFFIAILERST